MDFYNEYVITKLAKEHKLKHVIQLKGVYRGIGHVALSFKEYEMDLRKYLRDYRDTKQLANVMC